MAKSIGGSSMCEREMNQRVADQLDASVGLNGHPYRLGDCVALLDGNVVAVAKDLAGAVRALRALDPDPARGMVVEVGPVVVDVIR